MKLVDTVTPAPPLMYSMRFLLIGGMVSGYEDSPGHIVEIDGKKFKQFWGSASSYQSGKLNRIEGKKTLIEYKNETILDGLKYIGECLQSSISYGGGKELKDLDNVKWI